MRHLLAAAMLILPGGAMGEDITAQWMLWDDPAYLSLNWGTPDTDHVEVLFGCEPGVPEIDFVYFADMPDARDGLDVNVWLSHGTLEYLVPAIGERMAVDDSFALWGGGGGRYGAGKNPALGPVDDPGGRQARDRQL